MTDNECPLASPAHPERAEWGDHICRVRATFAGVLDTEARRVLVAGLACHDVGGSAQPEHHLIPSVYDAHHPVLGHPVTEVEAVIAAHDAANVAAVLRDHLRAAAPGISVVELHVEGRHSGRSNAEASPHANER